MNRRTAQQYLFSLLFVMLLGVGSCLAQTTIHVPSDVATIQGAINQAQNGDTILVAPGTYNENINFKGKAITVTSGAKSFADAASTVIHGVNDGPVVVFATNEPATAKLNGFTIQNGHASEASGLNGGGISISNASPTITNNVVSNNIGCGIFVFNSASPLIQGNDIKQNQGSSTTSGNFCNVSPNVVGAPSGTGLAIVDAGNVQVLQNTIEDNVQYPNPDNSPCFAGVTVESGAKVLLEDNIIRNNHSPDCASGVGSDSTKDLVLIQNLIYGNTNTDGTADGIQVFISGSPQAPYPTVTETNNTIYGFGQELVFNFGPSTITNNIFYNAGSGGYIEQIGELWCADSFAQNSPLTINNNDIFSTETLGENGCTMGSGNLAVAPVLHDPANGDFHEQPDSPTIDAGDVNAPQIPHADFDNKARIICNTVDMGAYEMHPTPVITLTSSLNPAPGGSSITFSAALAGGNCNVPTGTVTFLDGGQSIGTGILNGSGIATLTTSLLVVGQHKITATYPGDFNFDSSTSDVLIQTITGDATSTTLSVSPNPAAAYSPITLQSRVTSPYGTPTGQVEFFAGANLIATGALNAAGQASATVSTLGAGTYAITARYTADTRFQSSVSPTVQESVYGANTATALTASPNPAAVTQMVTFAVSVRAVQGSTHVPTGTVTLLDGGNVLGTIPLTASGTATFSTDSLSYGVHTITARYGGSGDFNPSSATLSESVTLIGTSLSLSVTPNPADAGQTVTMTAAATASAPGIVPFGAVTFRDGTTVLGTVALGTNASATFTSSTLAAGTHPIQASLSGSTDLAGSISPVVNEVIQAYSFTVQPSKTSISLPSGDWTEFPVTVTPIGGFKGTVQLSCSNLPDYALCTFPNGRSVSLASGAKTVEMAVSASDVYGYGKEIAQTPTGGRSGYLAMAFLSPFGLLCFWRRRRGAMLWIALFLVGGAFLLGLQGCGSKGPGKTAPGSYAINVTGASGGSNPQVETATIQLTITP